MNKNETPNWDEINENKRKEIMLGQAINIVSQFYTDQGVAAWENKDFVQNTEKMYDLIEECRDKILNKQKPFTETVVDDGSDMGWGDEFSNIDEPEPETDDEFSV